MLCLLCLPLQGRKWFSTEMLCQSEKLTSLLPWKEDWKPLLNGNLHCYNKLIIVGLEVWISVLKLTSGKKVLVYQKTRLWISPVFAFQFPGCCYFVFSWRQMVATTVGCFIPIAASIWCHKNSKWQCVGNSKMKIGDIHIQLISTLELSLHLLT